jgi:hypothetical protein
MKAIIKHHVFTHNGEHDLSAGDKVNVTYWQDIWCSLRGRLIPVYHVTGIDGFDHGYMYVTGLDLIEESCA